MNFQYIEPIKAHPSFIKLKKKRRKLAVILSILMLSIYFSFILTIAFAPHVLAQPVSKTSVITIGIPWGIGVIICAFVLTGVYVYKANREFDVYTQEIHKDVVEI